MNWIDLCKKESKLLYLKKLFLKNIYLYYNPLLNKFVNIPVVPFDEHKSKLNEYVNVQL